MRAIDFAAIVSGLIAAAPISAAADQTITETFNLTVPPAAVLSIASNPLNFTSISSTPFPLFAPTTGTLDSVSAMITGSFSWASIAENPDVKFVLEVGNGLKGFDFIGGMPVFTNVGTIDLNIGGGGLVGARYVGAGNADAILFFATDNPANTGVIESNGLVAGSITYTYMPPTETLTLSVPESSTWAMMLLGLTGLGFAAFRRTVGRESSVRITAPPRGMMVMS
jgi:hypothetical protein